jgi:hypothetical protein
MFPTAPAGGEMRVTAHWTRVGPLVAIRLVGSFRVTGTHIFFPSIAVSDSGDAAIGFGASAGTIFASAAYTA